ncbi:FHA domain-containing protein [Mycolicibacterium fortuitum]|uniref:FHA domain-containing protein n=1 Tax=Mycolicibacterium fortuitum TaxID=1766 RepID=UPI0009D77DBB
MSPPVAGPPPLVNDGDNARTVAVRRTPRQLPKQATAHLRAAPHAELGSAVLYVVRGPTSGAECELTHPYTTAGRHRDSTVLLDHVTVSRRHAEFRWVDGHYWVIDTGSLNGVYVNQIRVESAPLTNGDEIWIGAFDLTFNCRELDAPGAQCVAGTCHTAFDASPHPGHKLDRRCDRPPAGSNCPCAQRFL